jgi:dipeptidase
MRILIFTFLSVFSVILMAQTADKSDWKGGVPEGCTSVTVGKNASFDGSVMTSHTDDSHRTRSWMDIVPAKKHNLGERMPLYKRMPSDSLAMPTYAHKEIGSIPQIAKTHQYINTAYASMNEHQLAIGESTFGGREELQSDEGLIDCQRLCVIMLERCSTARQAIELTGHYLKNYGWNDYGECLTIADPNEVWHLEIVGPGKGKKGAIWVAQRVPDGHVSVNANASTVKEIDISNAKDFMASDNIFEVAKENGWWKEGEEPFRFNYAYAPESRLSLASRRREWRVFELVAPSLKLDPNGQDFPFSVKPDTLVTLEKMVQIFKDYYENTPFDMTKNMTVANDSGKMVKSPLANPFMPYDANKLHKVNGGWGWLGERTIARWYTMYGTIIQCRSWLPNMIGGVEWLALDNIASSIYIPVYAGTIDLPESYKTPGRPNGFTRESAWWAFNRMGTLASQRWGDMRHDVDAVWLPMQEELFENQSAFEAEALKLYEKNPEECSKHLTDYTLKWGNKVVDDAWKLGDFLWTKYDEKF